jgi:surface protein
MATIDKRPLKAYVRFDGMGRIVPSSLILRRKKPKVGNWVEIPAYECCNETTTSTTTVAPLPSGPTSFISTWRTINPNTVITLPYIIDGTYSGTIDWGDGSASINSYDNRFHTYVTPGDYIITITGTVLGSMINGLNFDNIGGGYIRSISQWGDLRLGNGGFYFTNCNDLDLSTVTDVLNLSGTTNLSYMFSSCTSLTTINRIDEWDVSNVTNMQRMFENCILFNQDISNWNVSNVTDMNNMFSNAGAFNQNIELWNVSSVTNMRSMFSNADSFNQPLDGWNVSNVTDMSNMFIDTMLFNQPLNNWNVSSVTNMFNMFAFTSAFNQPLNNWNVGNVTDMIQMFGYSDAFNQDLSSWCVTNISSEPANFSAGNTVWVLPKPVWGTCPP